MSLANNEAAFEIIRFIFGEHILSGNFGEDNVRYFHQFACGKHNCANMSRA